EIQHPVVVWFMQRHGNLRQLVTQIAIPDREPPTSASTTQQHVVVALTCHFFRALPSPQQVNLNPVGVRREYHLALAHELPPSPRSGGFIAWREYLDRGDDRATPAIMDFQVAVAHLQRGQRLDNRWRGDHTRRGTTAH